MPPHTSEQSALLTSGTTDARKAFDDKDLEASRKYHDSRRSISTDNGVNKRESGEVSGEEGHQSEGGLLKPIIFGGLDGILTSFAIVAGAAGGGEWQEWC